MQKDFNTNNFSVMFLLSGIAAWIATAMVLLPIGAFILSRVDATERILAYFSSALNFAAASAAGAAAVRKNGRGRLLCAALVSTFIVILLLFLGFVISSSGLSPDGVLSVVMFTYSGGLFGAVFVPAGAGKDKLRAKAKRRVRG